MNKDSGKTFAEKEFEFLISLLDQKINIFLL